MMGMFDVAGLGLLGPAVPSNVGLYTLGCSKNIIIIYTFFVMSKLTMTKLKVLYLTKTKLKLRSILETFLC